jgi:PTS system fructose-specific IIC component
MGSVSQVLLVLVALAIGVVVMASIVIFLKSRDTKLAEVEAVATV